MEKYSMTQEELSSLIIDIVQKIAPYTTKETVLSLLNQELDDIDKDIDISYAEETYHNELKAFSITCTVEGKYTIVETGQSFEDVVVDANDEFLYEEDRTDLYSLEHDEWQADDMDREYNIFAKVNGKYEVTISAESENDAIDKAEWEYDSADFGDLDNLDRGDFEIQDVNDDEYTLSCEVEGVFSTVITAESLEAALEDAEDEYNESSFAELINPERDDFEADDVDYTLVCNVSALYSETIYAFNVYDAVERFKEIVHDECDFPNDFDGDFEVTNIGYINIDSEKIQSSKDVAEYLLNSSYRLVAERYNCSAELLPNIPFTENINNISDYKEISDIIYSNLSKGISTAEGRDALKQFLKNELAVNSDPVECRGIENNLLPAIDELNALSGKDFTPYGILPDMDKLVDSNNIDDRIFAANNCYGLDKLINDECDRVRMAVAAQGYGKDILVKDVSQTVRDAVKQYRDKQIQSDISNKELKSYYMGCDVKCKLPEGIDYETADIGEGTEYDGDYNDNGVFVGRVHYEVTVTATDVAKAKEMATEMWENADFGDLEDLEIIGVWNIYEEKSIEQSQKVISGIVSNMPDKELNKDLPHKDKKSVAERE